MTGARRIDKIQLFACPETYQKLSRFTFTHKFIKEISARSTCLFHYQKTLGKVNIEVFSKLLDFN